MAETSANGPYDPMTVALARELCKHRAIHCEVIATDGDEPRWNGGCPHETAAVKWEDDFLDLVCEKHACGAEERGAQVVWASASGSKQHDAPPA